MQYTRKDWVRAGLNTLAEEGVEAVRVEAIARKLSISKGSFYHHFADRQDLLHAMIDYWELHATERIISAPEAEQATLEQLLSFVFATERKTEAAMYAWAKQNPELGRRVAGIEKRRIGYVAALYAKKGLSPDEANARAHLAYLVYIGWLVRGELDEPFDIAAPLQHFLKWTT